MRRVLIAAVVVAFLAPVSAVSAPVPATGLRGLAVLYPASPVCFEGDPCTRPAAHVVLAFWHNAKIVKRTTTAADGKYRVRLPAGTYRVSAPAYRIGSGVAPKSVRVAKSQMRRVNLTIDTGIQ